MSEHIYTYTVKPLVLLKNPNILKYHRFVKEFLSGSYTKFVLAGGAVRDYIRGNDSYVKDYDFFLSTPLSINRLKRLEEMGTIKTSAIVYPGFNVTTFTPNRVKGLVSPDKDITTPIQFIYNEATPDNIKNGSVEDLIKYTLNEFDWSINRCAYDGANLITYESYTAPRDVLFIHNPSNHPIAVLYRGLKLKDKYNMFIDNDSFIKVCKAIANQDNDKQAKLLGDTV